MPLTFSGQAQSEHAEGKEYAAIDPLIHRKDTTWGEQWAASLGKTIDEELSISKYLNLGGWKDRDLRIQEMIEDGEDLNAYREPDGSYAYDAIAKDFPGSGVKTDGELWKMRVEELEARRNYGESLDGPASAAFLGGMHGAMMDPINMGATVLAAPASVAARATTVMGAAARVAGVEAAINGAIEIPIQSFVNSYKQDIESPYSHNDMFMAIGGAMLFGGAIGGVTGGVGEYARRALAKRNAAYGGLIDEWRTNVDMMEELGAPAEDIAEAKRAVDMLQRNPNRAKVEEMRTTLAAYLRQDSDEILKQAEELGVDSWQYKMAQEIEKRRDAARATVPERKTFEMQEVEDVLIGQGIAPSRAAELAEQITKKSLTPEYRAKLESRLEGIEKKLSSRKSLDKNIPARKRKKLAADDTKKVRGWEAEKADLESRLKADDEAIAAREELANDGVIVDEEATAKARAAEEDRVKRITALEEERWNDFIKDALIKADLDYLRQRQKEFNNLEAKRGTAPTNEERTVLRTNAEEVNEMEIARYQDEILAEGGEEAELLDQLQKLKECKYG